MAAKEKSLLKHSFNLSPKERGNESLTITTEFVDNGDRNGKSIYTNQTLTLQSYYNSASFNLNGIQITPEILRKLANELDEARTKAMFVAQQVDESVVDEKCIRCNGPIVPIVNGMCETCIHVDF